MLFSYRKGVCKHCQNYVGSSGEERGVLCARSCTVVLTCYADVVVLAL